MHAIIVSVIVMLFLGLLPFVLDRGRITPAVQTIPRLSVTLVGYAVFDLLEGQTLWPYYALGILALTVGFYTFGKLASRGVRISDLGLIRKRDPGGEIRPFTDGQRRQMTIFCSMVCVFVLYHFAVGGIPVLRPDVEVARFEFTSSGLFGIPGRMTLYGLPFIVLYVSLYHWRSRDKQTVGLFCAVWMVYFISCLLCGFKSSVTSVIGLFLLSRALAGRHIHIRQLFAGRMLFLVALALLYAGWMSFRYTSVGVTNTATAVTYMKMRMAAIPAEPGHYAMAHLSPRSGEQPYIIQDLLYFLRKYSGLRSSNAETFPLDKRVSAAIYGIDLSEDNWIVPVTVGAYAAWYVDVGPYLAFIAMLVIGAVFSYAVTRCSSATTAFSAAMWGLCVMRIASYLGQGNLAHTTINLVGVLAFLVALKFAAAAIASVRPLSSPSSPDVESG